MIFDLFPMRHRNKKKVLDRNSAARKSLIKNLAVSFIINEKIKTVKIKAKILKAKVEKLITISKKGDLSARRRLISFLGDRNQHAVRKLIEEIGPRYLKRPGGYTRLRLIGKRQGDNAEMAQLELI